jgi:hypothetical protein
VILLRDEEALPATAAWGLKVKDAEAPWPATYVVDGNGQVRWRHLRDTKGDWPTYDELSAALSGH